MSACLCLRLPALGVASAHVAHGITVDYECFIEGKGGCKDLGTVTAGSVEACYEVSMWSVYCARLYVPALQSLPRILGWGRRRGGGRVGREMGGGGGM